MKVILYQTSSDNRDMVKNLVILKKLECKLKDACDIVNPQVVISNLGTAALSKVNYAYIPDFGRYYYISTVSTENGGRNVLSMHCDVLMSFRTQILNCEAFITRNEYQYDKLLQDDRVQMKKTTKKTLYNIATLPNVDRYFVTTMGAIQS